MSKPYTRLDKNNAAVLLVDHQAGLLSLVRDFDPDRFKNNVLALADLARYFELPTILTTSFEDGPNGPLVPELKQIFPNAPFIARPGQINAWDNEDFVRAVKATGKKQLVIAGVVTEVCVAFPTLSALAEGFEVFVVTDASGTFNEVTRDAAWSRMATAGAQLMNRDLAAASPNSGFLARTDRLLAETGALAEHVFHDDLRGCLAGHLIRRCRARRWCSA
ncbi:MAG: isochorismate family cysteine hydrolase YcaC [Polyangia bacterium]